MGASLHEYFDACVRSAMSELDMDLPFDFDGNEIVTLVLDGTADMYEKGSGPEWVKRKVEEGHDQSHVGIASHLVVFLYHKSVQLNLVDDMKRHVLTHREAERLRGRFKVV